MTRVLLLALGGMVLLGGTDLLAQEQETPRPAERDPFPVVRVGRFTFAPGVRIKGDIPAAGTERGADDGPVDIEQRRVTLRGEYGRASFEVSRELGDRTPWRDVYLDYQFDGSARLRAGQFKMPLGLEATTGGGNLDFVDRTHVAKALGGGRQVGVMAHGRLWRRRVEYEVGLFDGGRPPAAEPDAVRLGSTLAARVLVAPMARARSAWRTLQVGAAVTGAAVDEGLSSQVWRDSVEVLADTRTDVWVMGSRLRMGLESRWRSGPVGVAGEYIRSVDERREQGVRHEDLSPVPTAGWYVGGSWIVTGERKTNNVEPRRSILEGGPGAFEVAGRWEGLAVGDGEGAFEPILDPRTDRLARRGVRGWTAGLNWYAHRWLTLQFNVTRDELTGVWVNPVGPAPTRTARTLRVQFEL